MNRLALALALLLVPAIAAAQVNVYSDGSDGALNVPANQTVTIDLTQAPTAAWNTAGSGHGVYDANKWAVVFKYSSVYVGPGATVNFKNNATNAPVVWLVNGSANIMGTVSVDGNGQAPGPGGFAGGRATSGTNSPQGAGLGPGGGFNNNPYASYGSPGYDWGAPAAPTYGNSRVLPLIGGSGGAGGSSGYPGGGGAGAILIAARDTILVGGTISASPTGYSYNFTFTGAGSGGGVRLVAANVLGGGTLAATGYGSGATASGAGRIRIEANNLGFVGSNNPAFSPMSPLPSGNADIWPADTAAVLSVVSVNGVAIPADPHNSFGATDLTTAASGNVNVVLAGTNVPTTATVTVRVIFNSGQDYSVNATFQSGNKAASTWTATLNGTPALPSFGAASIQARAAF